MGDSSFWRYPFFTPALGTEAREPAAHIEAPLRLEHRHRWDPGEEYWGEPGEPLEPYLHEIFAAGPREAWEQEQLVPGAGGEAFHDPILEATELFAGAERDRARGLLVDLLAEERRCLGAHWIDNRPFLRCLHGYGLCLWRLGRFAEAEPVFEALLWLNPGDNQGARELVDTVRARSTWEPMPRLPGKGWADGATAGEPCSTAPPRSSRWRRAPRPGARSSPRWSPCCGCSTRAVTAACS